MTPTTFLSFPSPAKINLFLHIIGQRADGYHKLETLFQFLDYGDTVDIMPDESGNLNLLTPIPGVENNDNLIIKAAKLLQHYIQDNVYLPSHKKLGAQIRIDKKLPMGGGLGGGSSNAATVLLALNALWKANLPTEVLANLGVKLGADVPVFIHGYAALAQGIGEKLTYHPAPEYWYLISKPNCSISTQSVFQSPELTRDTPSLDLNNINIELCHNDCESLVIKEYPEVAKLLAWLLEYAPSRMTGTGACIFTRFSSFEEASALQKKLPTGVTSFVAKGINSSPLIAAVSALNI